MTPTADETRELLRQKNATFFKRKYPEVFRLLKTNNLIHKTPLKNEHEEWVDTLERGTRTYGFDAKEYSIKECEKFIDEIKPGKEITTVVQASSRSFAFDRLASNKLRVMHQEVEALIDIKNSYKIMDFIPLLVVFGIGMGFHITELIKNKRIGSLIIYDNDIENLLISLSTTDWEWVDSHFDPNKGTSLQFSFSLSNSKVNDKSVIWNTLTQYCPHFPFTCFLYNHNNKIEFRNIINEVQNDIVNFMAVWGHYDDEINQYNNCRHNLKLGIPILTPSKLNCNKNIPVAIIGGGPSLDSKIDFLKSNREELILVSCGSSLGTLFHYNITPDIHVELESDFLVHDVIEKTTTQEYRDKILFLGAAQLNPRVFNLFKNRLIYFKDSAASVEEFSTDRSQIMRNVTPTCTNAGFSIIDNLSFKNIYLFGMDFGFESENSHHAKGSIHYQDSISKTLLDDNDFNKNPLIKVKGVNGKEILTKATYNVARKRVEEGLKSFNSKGKRALNCSDGAIIKNAPWTPIEQLQININKINKSYNVKDEIEKIALSSILIRPNEVDYKCMNLIQKIKSILETLEKRIIVTNSKFDISKSSFIVNNILEQHVMNKMGYTYYFIRGYIWIVLSTYYNVALKSNSDSITEKCTNLINKNFKIINSEIINEMKLILLNDKSIDEDAWINEEVPIHKDYL